MQGSGAGNPTRSNYMDDGRSDSVTDKVTSRRSRRWARARGTCPGLLTS